MKERSKMLKIASRKAEREMTEIITRKDDIKENKDADYNIINVQDGIFNCPVALSAAPQPKYPC